MAHLSKKRLFFKVFIILILVGFIAFTALSAVMYLASPSEKNKELENLQINCENNGFTRDIENETCLIQEQETNTKENCENDGGTWYEENEVCIN